MTGGWISSTPLNENGAVNFTVVCFVRVLICISVEEQIIALAKRRSPFKIDDLGELAGREPLTPR